MADPLALVSTGAPAGAPAPSASAARRWRGPHAPGVRVPRRRGRAFKRVSAPRPRRGSTSPCRYATRDGTTRGARPAARSRRCRSASAGRLASAPQGRDWPRPGRAPPSSSPARCTGGKSHRKTRLCAGPMGPHADSAASVTREKEGAFFLVSSLRAIRASLARMAGSELVCSPSATVLCFCTILRAMARDFELSL